MEFSSSSVSKPRPVLQIACQNAEASQRSLSSNRNAMASACSIPASPLCGSRYSRVSSRKLSPFPSIFAAASASASRPHPLTPPPSLYHEFVQHSISEVGKHGALVPVCIEKGLKEAVADDGKTMLYSYAFESSKMRLLRITNINGGENLQVLNMAIFPNPEYDLPIFCADFFSTSSKHIIVLDLNPLYNTEKDKSYKAKYYSGLMPLVNKYLEILPWGQELTTESLQFFSPLVIWTKPESRYAIHEKLFPAFKDYLQAWLKLMDNAEGTSDPEEIVRNRRAQHRYLLWRATKDPGRPLLRKLFGDDWSEMYINEFLFNGVSTLGRESFLDYFPEYRGADGGIDRKRSIIGKSFPHRPWDKHGSFVSESRNHIAKPL